MVNDIKYFFMHFIGYLCIFFCEVTIQYLPNFYWIVILLLKISYTFWYK